MLWAEEMKKCNEIMHSMAECQKIYEEKARIAEEKLEDWKKGNRKPQKDRIKMINIIKYSYWQNFVYAFMFLNPLIRQLKQMKKVNLLMSLANLCWISQAIQLLQKRTKKVKLLMSPENPFLMKAVSLFSHPSIKMVSQFKWEQKTDEVLFTKKVARQSQSRLSRCAHSGNQNVANI